MHFEPRATCGKLSLVQSQGDISPTPFTHFLSARKVRKSIELNIAGTVLLQILQLSPHLALPPSPSLSPSLSLLVFRFLWLA